MRGMAENTAGQGGPPADQYPPTVTDGASAIPPQAPPLAYTPTQAYPQQPYPPQPPTQAYPPQGVPPQGGPPQGAPQQPVQPPYGSYGYPQPQTPGYPPQQPQGGYPAAGGYPPPQAPYPGQGGYPQQPGPYPPQQPGYQQGYPVPGYPQPPAPPRRGLGKGAVIGILGGVLALIVIAATAVALNSGGKSGGGGGGGGTGGKTLAKAWSVPASGSSDRLVGSWLTGTDVIRASSGGGVVAYNLMSGDKEWTVTPPADASVPCGMSPTVNASGIGTIAFGTDATSCKYVAGVNSGTGVISWKVDLIDSDDTVASSAQTFVQGTVATVLSEGRAAGFDTTTGKRIWLNPARGQSCNETAYGTTGVVIIDDFCADVSPEKTLTALNAANGKRLWRTTESDHVLEGAVLNGSPLVASLSPDENAPVSVYSSTGHPTSLDMTGFSLSLGNTGTTAVKLAGQTLVVQSSSDSTAAGSPTQVIAYDLTDGHQLWHYNGESGHGAVLAQPTGTGVLYALSTGTFSGSPHFVKLDPVTGKSTILGALDSSADGWLLSDGTIYALPNDGGVLTLNGFGSTDIPGISVYK